MDGFYDTRGVPLAQLRVTISKIFITMQNLIDIRNIDDVRSENLRPRKKISNKRPSKLLIRPRRLTSPNGG